MKNDKKIFIAFVLNFLFSIIEFFGGIITGSVAIFSDAVHDLGDSVSIGTSYFLERKSSNPADKNYTFGYSRFSPLGGFWTTIILIIGSVFVLYNAILRLISPSTINYDGMIIFAVFGVVVNLVAVFFTKDSHTHQHNCHNHLKHHHDNCQNLSINKKAVNLHMLEDVFGWLAVLIGSIIMRFTNFWFLDPILSICISVFIIINALKNGLPLINLFLLKTPKHLNADELKNELTKISGVLAVLEIKILQIDENKTFIALKIKKDKKINEVQFNVKKFLKELNIHDSNVELIE